MGWSVTRCHHHKPLSHLNVLSIPSCWRLAPVRLFLEHRLSSCDFREAVLSTLTLSHLSDNRKMRQRNPIFPAAPQLCCYRHHSVLAHLNMSKVESCWMLAPLRLWMRKVSHQYPMSWYIANNDLRGQEFQVAQSVQDAYPHDLGIFSQSHLFPLYPST